MEAMMKDIRDKAPQAYNLFEMPITEAEMREKLDDEDVNNMIGESLTESYGLDYIIDPTEFPYAYELNLNNAISTDDFVELYLFDVIDEDNDYFYLQGAEKDEALRTVVNIHFTQDRVNEFRLNHINKLNFNLTLKVTKDEILLEQPWLSDTYVAQYLESHYEPEQLKSMIEKRYALGTGGQDTFLERFYEAGREIEAVRNIPVEEFDYDTTPFKVISVRTYLDFGEIAEIFTPYIQRHATLHDFVASDFYNELIDNDFVDYELQLDIDPEDF